MNGFLYFFSIFYEVTFLTLIDNKIKIELIIIFL